MRGGRLSDGARRPRSVEKLIDMWCRKPLVSEGVAVAFQRLLGRGQGPAPAAGPVPQAPPPQQNPPQGAGSAVVIVPPPLPPVIAPPPPLPSVPVPPPPVAAAAAALQHTAWPHGGGAEQPRHMPPGMPPPVFRPPPPALAGMHAQPPFGSEFPMGLAAAGHGYGSGFPPAAPVAFAPAGLPPGTLPVAVAGGWVVPPAGMPPGVPLGPSSMGVRAAAAGAPCN